MKKSDLILQVRAPGDVTLKIYIKPDNSVRLHKSQVVSPWPDHYSMKDILAKEYQERRNGKIVHRDAHEHAEFHYQNLKEAVSTLVEEGGGLSNLSISTIRDHYRKELRAIIDISTESGPFKEEWEEVLSIS